MSVVCFTNDVRYSILQVFAACLQLHETLVVRHFLYVC